MSNTFLLAALFSPDAAAHVSNLAQTTQTLQSLPKACKIKTKQT
jgi:hypothetical protein